MGRLLQMRQPIRWIPIDSTALESAAYVAQRRWHIYGSRVEKSTATLISRPTDTATSWPPNPKAPTSANTSANNSDTNTFLDLATPANNYRGLLRTLTIWAALTVE